MKCPVSPNLILYKVCFAYILTLQFSYNPGVEPVVRFSSIAIKPGEISVFINIYIWHWTNLSIKNTHFFAQIFLWGEFLSRWISNELDAIRYSHWLQSYLHCILMRGSILQQRLSKSLNREIKVGFKKIHIVNVFCCFNRCWNLHNRNLFAKILLN